MSCNLPAHFRLRRVFGFRLQSGQILPTGEPILSVGTAGLLRHEAVIVRTARADYLMGTAERVLVFG